MAVMERPNWTDERLDDLNGKVDGGFGEMRTEFRSVRTDMREELAALRTDMREELAAVRTDMREDLAGVRKDMRAVQAEIGALNRTIHQFMFAMVGTVFLGFTGTIAALITLV